MQYIQNIIYIQKLIFKCNTDYVISDIDLNKLFNTNIRKVIKKNKRLFNNGYCYKTKNNYFLKKEGIILLSLILNSYYISDLILDSFYSLENINKINLNKIKQTNMLFVC